MSNITIDHVDEIKLNHFFSVNVEIEFIYKDDMSLTKTFPVQVIIKTEDSNIFNLDNMAFARIKATELLNEYLKDYELEDYAKKASAKHVSIKSVSYLGMSTSEDFLGKLGTKKVEERTNEQVQS